MTHSEKIKQKSQFNKQTLIFKNMLSRISINFQRKLGTKKSTFTPPPLRPRQVMSFSYYGWKNGLSTENLKCSELYACPPVSFFWFSARILYILYPITVYVKFSFFRKLVKRHITILDHAFFDNSRPILRARRNMNLLFLSSEATLSERSEVGHSHGPLETVWSTSKRIYLFFIKYV